VTEIRFPPQPSDERTALALLEVFRSVVPNREAWYVSTPITTGRRLHEIRMRNGTSFPENYQTFLQEHVIEPNRREARRLVSQVRRDRSHIAIDPSAVNDIPGWGQDDYRYFWGLVIKEFVRCVVFSEGWEHSSGCSYEFLVAIQAQIETLDHRFNPLPREKGIVLLKHAIAAAQGSETDASFLQAVLDALLQRDDFRVP
jgi:hypothetical protein